MMVKVTKKNIDNLILGALKENGPSTSRCIATMINRRNNSALVTKQVAGRMPTLIGHGLVEKVGHIDRVGGLYILTEEGARA